MAYTSQYTGAELDEAIRLTLGGEYRGDTGPGCHLIGDSSDMPQNLNDLAIPGKYTVYFFENGPVGVDNVISPICVQVYWAGQFLYQTITIGTKFYWRDLISGDLTWKMIDLGVEATKVVDNLYTSVDRDASADEMALSANMGAELRKMIEKQAIGNINLLDCTGELQGYIDSDNITRYQNYWTSENATWEYASTTNTTPSVATDISGLLNTGLTSVKINYNGYVTSFGSYIKAATSFVEPYTASVYVRAIDPNVAYDTLLDTDKVYIKIIVKDSSDSNNDKVVTKEYKLSDIVQSIEFAAGLYRLQVTLNRELFGTVDEWTKDVTDCGTRTIHVCFGCTCSEDVPWVQFFHPKLEYGYYATEYNHSANDLKYWYTNCEKIFDVDIDATTSSDFNEQDGLVYDSTSDEFKHEPVAVGGGGGFVTCTDVSELESNTRKDKILAFVNAKNNTASPKRLICLDSETGEWITVTNPAFVRAARDPSGYFPVNNSVPYDCGWLDITNENVGTPAILNYYDEDRNKWRPVGAIATSIWILQEDPPTDSSQQHLIWIKESTMAPYIYVNGEWRPLLTIWGAST